MIQVGTLRYLKMSLDSYHWTQGKRVLEAISTIEEKPVAVMQDNGDGTFEVAVRRFNHVYHTRVHANDFME